MSEGVLIEIAQRFRHLEDVIEDVIIRPGADGNRRENVEASLEACRDDMVAISECLRKGRD